MSDFTILSSCSSVQTSLRLDLACLIEKCQHHPSAIAAELALQTHELKIKNKAKNY